MKWANLCNYTLRNGSKNTDLIDDILCAHARCDTCIYWSKGNEFEPKPDVIVLTQRFNKVRVEP